MMTSTETAVSLMRMALALLERERDEQAAGPLRAAIEVATRGTLSATPREPAPPQYRSSDPISGTDHAAPMRLRQSPI